METRWVLLLIIVFSLAAAPAYAIAFRGGDQVRIDEDGMLLDNTYATGGDIRLLSAVMGDFMAAGGTVVVEGKVARDVAIAGGQIRLENDIGQDARVVGGTVSAEDDIWGDLVAVGGKIYVDDEVEVAKDVSLVGGDITLLGTVRGDASLTGGRVTFDGIVMGDLDIESDDITFGDNAVVHGNITYTSRQALELTTGQARGRIFHITPEQGAAPGMGGLSIMAYLGFRLIGLFALLLVGILLLLLLPNAGEGVAAAVGGAFWRSLGTGLLFLILVPAIVVALLLTVIGIPLGLIVAACWLIVLYLSRVWVALWIGDRFWARSKRKPHLVLRFAVGLLFFCIVSLIPGIGQLVHIIAVLVGAGALCLFAAGFVAGARKKRML
ncbi:hypothetical protein JXB02_06590 [Candidatus Woesearchaeota archaeon]|nr:hypothetical protein [Candidatus Woesearchaeota archaeon]